MLGPMKLAPVPALLLAMIILQIGAALAKELFPALGPAGATTLRTVLAAALVTLVLRPDWSRLTRADWLLIVPYGASLGLMNLSFYFSLVYLPLGLAVTTEFLGPLLLALALSRRALDWMWVGLAGLGIALIAPHGGNGSLSPVGIGLALLAGALWALYIVVGGKLGRQVPGTLGVASGLWVAAVVVFPFGLWQAGGELFSPRHLPVALAVAALSSALPYLLEMVALRALPAQVFGVLMSLEPAFAAVSGALLLREQLSAPQWVALGCVVAASAGISLTQRPAAPEAPTPA